MQQHLKIVARDITIQGDENGVTNSVGSVNIESHEYVPLTPQEKLTLNKIEAEIKPNLKAFIIVGERLKQIHDAKLYREYGSFTAYLDRRWGMSDKQAYRLMNGYQVAQNVSPIGEIPNEWTARQLADLEPEAQQFVFAVAKAKSEGAPTASVIKSIRRQLTEATVTGGYLDLGDGKPIALDAAITQDAYETMQRQKQHIADNSNWDRLTTFEVSVSEAAQRLEESMVSLDSSEIVKISVYVTKTTIES